VAEREQQQDSARTGPEVAEAPPEFLSVLAHELRNPLAPIRNGTELLRSICSEPRQQYVVEMISRQVVHLTHMLDDLLDVARLRRGLVTLRKQPVDVALIVEQALEAIRPAIDARQQSLLVSLPAEAVQMYCDPVRLVQVLQNLLDNANRFTARGGAISLQAEVADPYLIFHVVDNGSGIDPTLLPRLFNVFAQGAQPMHRPEGGLGLGLAIARNLVEMHGGTISAFSAGRGQGSRFTVRLPIEQPL
jgi:signal transduction histidine kinase